ncbi:hypothetical protein [Peptostreptococcus porci]|nr:hypothetical protein [Peptostreptococcus porci]MDY5437176.1 hypothetical protein [Peptostreptococcus porci]
MIYKKRLKRKVYFVDDSEYDIIYANNEPYEMICTNKKYKKVSLKKYEK